MKGIISKKMILRGLLPIALIALLGIGLTQTTLAQVFKGQAQIAPRIPQLSLTGDDGGYDDDWYPDGRLLLPISLERITDANSNYAGEGAKEIYIPIFIQNTWNQNGPVTLKFANDTVTLDPSPIESFKFTLLYRSEVFQPLGIVTEHPRMFVEEERPGTDVSCDAKDWNISFNYEKSDRYRTYLVNPATNINTAKGGMKLTITGVSNGLALPTHNEFRVLCYVKMRVRPYRGQLISDGGIEGSNLIIDNQEILYNDYNVTEHAPFIEWRSHINSLQANAYENLLYPGYQSYWPHPKHNYYNIPSGSDPRTPGLAGISNYDENRSTVIDNPTLPGVLYVRLMQALPQFGFDMQRQIGNPEQLKTVKVGQFNEVIEVSTNDPLTIDSNSTNPSVASREFELVNTVGLTRIENITVESDQEWLQFQTIASKGRNVVPTRTRRASFHYLDNGTLGSVAINGVPADEELNDPNGDPGRVFFNITCDPLKLTSSPEKAGMYEGYITFRSDYALNRVVRLKVVFIYFRTPKEGAGGLGVRSGINLDIYNSRASVPGNPGPDKTNIIFGSGHRATDGVDTLFGEYAYGSPLTGFGARFYALDAQGNPLKDKNGNALAGSQYGFGDWAAYDEGPRSKSRDIRSSFDTNQSIIYYVKFDENGDENYPVVIEWDTRDFIPGSELFIRDTQNGQLFPSVNMRTANALGQFKRSYTIQDQRVNEFLIEYTLPKTVQFVDEYGNAIIQEGWNFLSLPVNAVNTKYNVLYPNVINKPIFFTPNTYQQDEILRAGIGYFMRYSSTIDKTFAGTFISEISTARQNAPRVYPGSGGRGGWNSVGAISVPTSVNNIEFETFNNTTPDKNYTLEYGVWRYVTDKGYEEVSTILPGLGYWIKVNNNGYYNLKQDNLKVIGNSNVRNNNVYANSTKISVKDNGANNGELFLANSNVDINKYELPPVPPTGVFDVRFRGSYKVDNNNETVINLQGVEYPVSISANYPETDLTFSDALTGEVYGTIARGTASNIIVKNSLSNSIVVNKVEKINAEFGLEVYPNPVQASGNLNIAYTLTSDEVVNISLYDVLGNKVAEVINTNVQAGTHTTNFDVNNVPVGSYIVKIEAGSNVMTQKVSVIK